MGLIVVIGWIRSVFGVEIAFGFVALSFWVVRLNKKTESELGISQLASFVAAREALCFSFCILFRKVSGN